MEAPTSTSNWLIFPTVLVGAYPDPLLMYHQKIIDSGIDVFVCLQEKRELERFRDYRSLLPPHVKWINLPIPDKGITSDHEVIDLMEKMIDLLDNGNKIYIHCYGGHGRTGVVSALLIGILRGWESEEVLKYIKTSHSTRKVKSFMKSPQTKQQFDQVRRMLSLNHFSESV